VTQNSQSVLLIKGGEKSHRVQTAVFGFGAPAKAIAEAAEAFTKAMAKSAKAAKNVRTTAKFLSKVKTAGAATRDATAALLKAMGKADKAATQVRSAKLASERLKDAAETARFTRIARGGAIVVAVVVVVTAVVATVLITKKVKKDNRQRRAKLKKLKKYQKLRARAEIEYAHRHSPSK
jgi:hypothetical protein